MTLVLTVCLSILPHTSHASMTDKTIVMFIPDTDWPPYLLNDPSHPGKGVLVDVLKAVAEPMGYTVKTKRLPNMRGWLMLRQGEVDAHAKAKEWVPDADDYLWTEPFMLSEDVLICPATKPIEYTSPEQLYGKTVAAMQGFVYPALEGHFGPKKIKRRDVTSPFAMLELLSRGRVDTALVNRSETQWLFRNRPDLMPERFHINEKPFDSAGYRYVFTKSENWQPFIDEFNKVLKAMKHDGRLDAILDQYR